MDAYIYQPAKTSMQSGRYKSNIWVLEFDIPRHQYIEPLMNWIGSRETQSQVKLFFKTCQEACDYARKHHLSYEISMPQMQTFKPKSYSDNFQANRRR